MLPLQGKDVGQFVGTEKSTGVSIIGSMKAWEENGVAPIELGDVWGITGDNLEPKLDFGVFLVNRAGISLLMLLLLELLLLLAAMLELPELPKLGNLKSLHGGNCGTDALGFLVIGLSKDFDCVELFDCLWLVFDPPLQSNNSEEKSMEDETSVSESVSR